VMPEKNRRAVALTLTVGTVVPIDASHNFSDGHLRRWPWSRPARKSANLLTWRI
jgi:hypothetical protein